MMEPTDNAIHAGCLGNVNATWTFHGVAAHSARPWFGDNAITRAAAGVTALAAHEPEPHQFDGLEFVEVASVTKISGGIAMNVIPGEATAHVNYRYAPGRTPEEAEARLAELCAGHGELRIDANAPSGAVARGPLRGRADRRRRPRGGAEAGLDAGGGVRPRGRPGDQLRARRPAAGAYARRGDLGRGARPELSGAGGLRRGAMKPSPVLSSLRTYPFVRLTDAKRELLARGVEVVDFGIGEPREDTPPFIREAVAGALQPKSTYPLAEGLPELRAAIAAWIERRFGPALDPGTEVLPTLGSKEAIFHLAQVVGGDSVVVTTPGYPVAERGAAFAGKQVLELPLLAERGFLPDLDAVDWSRVGILWLNYPNNPTAATAPLELYERAAAIAREHDVVVASDEAYSEIYFGAEPPASALQVADRRNVIALNTLSKRSSMPGYRSGFVAGDPEVIAALKRYRPNVGVAPPEFIQIGAAAAWADEAHVEDVRALYRAKREVLLPVFEAAGIHHAGGDATFFLWLDAGERADPLAAALLERGVVVAPGSFFGPAGEGFLRLALVPTLAECERAAALLASVVGVQGGVEAGPGA